jgi:uncharacterized membrane protein
MVKSMAHGLAQVEGASDEFTPVLISKEDGWEIGYLLEELDHGWVAVLVPQAPTPLTGNIRYLPRDRIRLLNIPMLQARSIVKNVGMGSATALRDIKLGVPAA